MTNGSVLAPVSDTAYKEGPLSYYGAVELDVETGDPVWRFDATESDLQLGRYWQDGAVVKQTGFLPQSVQRLGDGTTLIADYSRGVLVDEDGDVRRTFSHELMNDVHEVKRTDEGTYLVASTGMDTLLILDEDFEELWRWHMWEHVAPDTRPGDYYADDLWHRDVRDLALNPDDRYHLNYVGPYDGTDELLCSALHYGVFTVDVATGEITREFRNMEDCHNPRVVEEGIAVAESGADRALLLDDDTREVLFAGYGMDCVKDVDPVGDGDWLLSDAKNDRLLIWERGRPEPHTEFHLGRQARPYEADYLSGSDSFANHE